MFGYAMWWLWLPLLLVFLFGPWRRTWRRRWVWDGDRPRGRRDRHTHGREHALQSQERQQQIDQLESRVAELESRLDFAERLLAQRREAPLGVTSVT